MLNGCLRVAMLGLAILGSGCAMLDPHIRPRLELHEKFGSTWDSRCEEEFAVDACSAIDSINDLRLAYFEGARQSSHWRSTTLLSVVPLSAASLYAGTRGNANPDGATRLALSAAAIFGADRLFDPASREAIYIDGMQALNCTLAKAAPLLLPRADFERFSCLSSGPSASVSTDRSATGCREILQTEPSLTEALAALDGELSAVQNTLAASAGEGLSRAFADAAGQRDGFQSVLNDARSRIRLIDSAGQRINDARRRINQEVDARLATAQPNAERLTALVADYPSLARSFSFGVGPFVPPPPPGSVGIGQGKGAGSTRPVDPHAALIERLNIELNRTARAASRVRSEIAALDKASAGELAAAACGLAAEPQGSKLSIVPPIGDARVRLVVNETRSYAVISRTGSPIIWPVGVLPDHLKYRIDLSGGNVVLSFEGLKATATPATFLISDASGSERVAISVNVEATASTDAVAD
jgi:hypothetical protein